MLIWWWWWWNAYVMKFSCWIKMKRSSTNIGDRLVYCDQQTWILPQDIHARLHELNGTWCAWTNEMSVSMSVSSYFYFSFTFTLSHLDSTRHSYIQFSFPIFHSLFLPYTHTHTHTHISHTHDTLNTTNLFGARCQLPMGRWIDGWMDGSIQL